MGNFIQVKETRYDDTFILNIDNVVIINFNSNYILVNGVHGEGNGSFTLDDDSMAKLYAAIKQPPEPAQLRNKQYMTTPKQSKDVDSSPSLEESKRIIEQFAPTPKVEPPKDEVRDKEAEFWKFDRRIRTLLKSYGYTPVNDLVASIHSAANDHHAAEVKLQQETLLSRVQAGLPKPKVSRSPNDAQNSYEVGYNDYRQEAKKTIDKLRLELLV